MDEFECVEFPPKLPEYLDIHRESCAGERRNLSPITEEHFKNYFDEEGRITNEHDFRKDVFKRGVASEARVLVWPFLFGLYQCNSTERERKVIQVDYSAKYTALKDRWAEALKVHGRNAATVAEDLRQPTSGATSIKDEKKSDAGDNTRPKRLETEQSEKLHKTKGTSESQRLLDEIKPVQPSQLEVAPGDTQSVVSQDHSCPNVLLEPQYLDGVPQVDSSLSPSHLHEDQKRQMQFSNFQAKVMSSRCEIDTAALIPFIKVIDKDVPRTDPKLSSFSDKLTGNLRILRNILLTYTAHHPEVGYTQGMNDIAALFLVVLKNEVECYWCFCKYMQHMSENFTESGMLNKLKLVRQLLSETDVDVLNYLDQLECGDLMFCHRWMMVSFKREFRPEDSLRCFEVLSSRHLELSSHIAETVTHRQKTEVFSDKEGNQRVEEPPKNCEFTFDVFMCATILMLNRSELFRCQDFCDVVSFIASLSMKMELSEILDRTEALFYKYCKKCVVNDCFQLLEIPSPSKSDSQFPAHQSSPQV